MSPLSITVNAVEPFEVKIDLIQLQYTYIRICSTTYSLFITILKI